MSRNLKIYKNTYTGDQFLEFYKEFLNTIDVDSINDKRYNRWTLKLKESFKRPNKFSEYEHLPFSFSRLGNTIDYMNKNSL